MRHNYWASTLEPSATTTEAHAPRACALQQATTMRNPCVSTRETERERESVCVCVCVSHWVMSDSLQPQGL